MKKTFALCLSSFALTVLFLLNIPQTFAANCSPLYNGGVTKQQYCFNPTPTPANANTDRNVVQPKATPKPNLPQQTKGGQRIYPATQSKTTPSTGPEEWALPALFLIGIMGFWLRNKAKT
jgi:hypothetical protein